MLNLFCCVDLGERKVFPSTSGGATIPIICHFFSGRRFICSFLQFFATNVWSPKILSPLQHVTFSLLVFLFSFLFNFEFSNFELWSCQLQIMMLPTVFCCPRFPNEEGPSLTNLSLHINSWCLIMVHTRRSPLSQPSTVPTRSRNVSILFALVSNEDSYSYEVCHALMCILSCSPALLSIIFLITNYYALLSFV